jgi:hypothetical protein
MLSDCRLCQLWHLSNSIIASTNGENCVIVELGDKKDEECLHKTEKFIKLSRKFSEIIKKRKNFVDFN